MIFDLYLLALAGCKYFITFIYTAVISTTFWIMQNP
jgi:hypothetical protein